MITRLGRELAKLTMAEVQVLSERATSCKRISPI
jgi:hypothetical protein